VLLGVQVVVGVTVKVNVGGCVPVLLGVGV
jgi:hypothetical protein